MKAPKISTPPPGPKAKPWIERAKAAMSSPPLSYHTVFTEGDGVYLKDLDGNRYLALTWASSRTLGFRHSEIVAAAKEQLEASGVGGLPGIHQPMVLLAEKIKEIVPSSLSTGKVGFGNTGSDITEAAMMLARGCTGKQVLLAFLGAVHGGSSIGARSISSNRSMDRTRYLPLVPSIELVPYPDCYRCRFDQEYPNCNLLCLDYVRTLLDTSVHPQEVAAFFVESIQSYGVIVPPIDYFAKLKKLCEEHNILFVNDEVIVGFGRTGKMWGIDHFGVEPDIQYMAKPIANGLSMAALISTPEIMDYDTQFHLVHGGAFKGNPIACTSALTHINILQRDKLADNAAVVGDYILKRLREFSETHELIGDVRGKGLFIGIELVKDHKTKDPATKEAQQVINEAFQRGAIVQTTGTYHHVLRLVPPLILTKDEAETGLNILEESLKVVERKL